MITPECLCQTSASFIIPSFPSMRRGEGGGICLDELRAQLQRMQSHRVPQQSDGGEAEMAALPAALSMHFGARLRMYQQTGAARRAGLSAAVARGLSDAEALRDAVAAARGDADGRLRALRRLIDIEAAAPNSRPDTEAPRRRGPAEPQEGEGRVVGALRELLAAAGAAQRELEADGSAERMAEERRRAEEGLDALRKRFVEFVQRGIDQMEELRRERVEAVEMCERILLQS